MLSAERLLLYSLVIGLQPRCLLEIGRSHGGSAVIMQSALEFTGHKAVLVSMDEAGNEGPHAISPQLQAHLSERGVRFLVGKSPDALPEARKLAPEPFDFVLVDGEHNGEQCLDDLEGVIPHLAPEAWILCHDAWFPAVERSINIARERYPLHDCGMLCNHQNREFMDQSVYGKPVIWGGFRLLQWKAR